MEAGAAAPITAIQSRRYRAAWGESDALNETGRQAGHHFDPELARLFPPLRGHSPDGPERVHAADCLPL